MIPPVFRSFEISDPAYERDDLRFVAVHSAALGARADVTFYVPPGLPAQAAGHVAGELAPTPAPLVIVLHGAYSAHWAWALKGGAHHTARRLIASGALPNVVLAMPSDGMAADSTGYIAHPDVDYASWIVNDVPAIAARVHPAVNAASPVCIAGLSMGGFGALYLGLRFCDRFAAVSAHSAVTDLAARFGRAFTPGHAEVHRLRNDTSLTVLHWARENRDRLPPFRFDCGRDDALCEQNRALHRALASERIDHGYEEFAGGHDWPYWRTHFEQSLLFFAQVLRASASTEKKEA